jgi:hypothetical protein
LCVICVSIEAAELIHVILSILDIDCNGLVLALWCLAPLSTIYQLYHGGQFYWWKKQEYPEKTTDLSQVINVNYQEVYLLLHLSTKPNI